MKTLSDYQDKFRSIHYNEDDEPIDFIGRIYFLLWDNLLIKIFLLAFGVVSGMLILLLLIDLIIYIVNGKTFFEIGKHGGIGEV